MATRFNRAAEMGTCVSAGGWVFLTLAGVERGESTDQPRFGIITSGCATITQLDSYEYQNADNIARNEYMPISKQFIITSTCSGNLAFGLYIDNNTNADDNSATSDVVISATKY